MATTLTRCDRARARAAWAACLQPACVRGGRGSAGAAVRCGAYGRHELHAQLLQRSSLQRSRDWR